MRPSTIALLATGALFLAACGDDDDGGGRLATGDCTDGDPTLVISAIEPDKVACDSEQAKSKIIAEEDAKEDCKTEAYIQQGDRYFCLAGHGKTFRSELEKATRQGEKNRPDIAEELKDALEDVPTDASTDGTATDDLSDIVEEATK